MAGHMGKGGALSQGPQRPGFESAFLGMIKPQPVCPPGPRQAKAPKLDLL